MAALSYHNIDSDYYGVSRLDAVIMNRICDVVSVNTVFEPITMTNLRLLRSEIIRCAKTIELDKGRAYDCMSARDMVAMIHTILRRRAEGELALAQFWANDNATQRIHMYMQNISSGTFSGYHISFYQRFLDAINKRVSIIRNPTYSINNGVVVF